MVDTHYITPNEINATDEINANANTGQRLGGDRGFKSYRRMRFASMLQKLSPFDDVRFWNGVTVPTLCEMFMCWLCGLRDLSMQDQPYEPTLFIRRNEFHRIRKCQIYFYNNFYNNT
jgi:hypothetical protein